MWEEGIEKGGRELEVICLHVYSAPVYRLHVHHGDQDLDGPVGWLVVIRLSASLPALTNKIGAGAGMSRWTFKSGCRRPAWREEGAIDLEVALLASESRDSVRTAE